MKRVISCDYESGNDIPILLMVDGVDSNNLNKSYPYKRVIHTKWTDDVTGCWHCSKCLHPVLLNRGEEYVFSNYCPNCGAKMDLENDDFEIEMVEE